MMNDSSIDHLMQITLPRTNWQGSSLASGRDDRPVFDDHLAQASAPRVPADPPRPTAARAPENSPPSGELPSQGQGTGGEVEDENDVAAEAPPAGNGSTDNSQAAEEASGDSQQAEVTQDEASESSQTAERASGEAPSENGDDHENEDEPTQKANLVDVAVVALTVVAQSQQEISREAEAATASSVELPADANAKEAPVTETNQNTNSSPAADPAASEAALQAASVPVELGAETSVHVKAPSANSQSQSDTPRRTGTKTDTPASQNSKGESVGTTSKRPRTSERDTESSEGRHASVKSEEAQKTDAAPQTERPATKTDNGEKVAETFETAVPRVAADRRPASLDAPSNLGKTPPAAAVQAATPDAAKDPAKPEGTDESRGPKAVHGPRSDALLDPLAKLHRNNTGIARSQREANGEDGPRVDATRFVNRVAKALHTAQVRGGTLQLRLSPPELGAMRIELLVQDGVLAAKLETETPAARRVLLDHLPLLRDRLAEQNIRIERFDVDVRQESGHSPPSPHEQRQQQPQNGSPHRQSTRQSVPVAESVSATPVTAGLVSTTQINLVA